MNRYKPYFEDIVIPLEKGDTFLWGKWKNKKAIFDRIEKDEKGQDVIITDTGKSIPLLKIRLIQESSNKIYFIRTMDKNEASNSDFKKLGDYKIF